MLVKVNGSIYMEVADEQQAEAAAQLLDSSLINQVDSASFPHGELVGFDVHNCEPVSAAEADEKGLVE